MHDCEALWTIKVRKWVVSRPKDRTNLSPEYEVEAIISHRRSGKGQAYLVKWKGYPTSENTWEPERNLYNAREILKQYKRRHQL